jgi:signal-transduction protein with cAMP-binding, CBS, and nucleotidyltransferase domain
MNARFNISNATNAVKPRHMPTHARTEDAIRFEQPISSILPSLSSDHAVWSISTEASVFEASERMTANNVGALVVLSAQKLDGIITQEDIRELVLQGKDARETRVSEIMTRGVYYVNPGMTIDACIVLMASRRLRHLPVLDGSRVISMISIDDILKRVTHASQS